MLRHFSRRRRLLRGPLVSRRHFSPSLHARSRSSPLQDAAKLSEGDKLFGYTVEKVTAVPDFDLAAVMLSHDGTGAQHVHLARRDSNNVFSVGFRTTPMDSTGVPHILEHTSLCGSARFPVRDPFFKMLTRSLSTFMNAFTASDWTMYPFSSQNEKDFQNLLSVYLDSVFFPRLREMDFRQEGWRLEHQDPRDPKSPIAFKGVVFNEMKGVFASSESIYAEALQNKLYPSHTYSHVSGGSPLAILDLTWEQLKEFHAKHYHPSNARFFTYGDMPLSGHLELINLQALQRFHRSSPSLEVPLEPRWTKPRDHQVRCPPDPMAANPEKQTTVSLSFLLADSTDPYESLVLSVLGSLLIDGPASPLYQALLDADIGADFSPMTGYEGSCRDSLFSVGLQGVKEGDVERVKEAVWSTLETVANEGFAEERIRAVLHQIELGLKHQSSSFGLSLIMMLISPWIHEGDPVAMLEVNQLVERFKEDIKNTDFLRNKIRQYFLDNKHHMTLTMVPDEQYESRQQQAEQAKLEKTVSALSLEQRDILFQEGLKLAEDQDMVQDASCLPTVVLSDVDRHIEYTRLDRTHTRGVPVQYSAQPTNGITYFRAVSGISMLSEHLKIYLPLFCNVITRMGAGGLDHRQFAQQCDLYTSGLSVSPHVVSHHTNDFAFDQGVLLSSHCLDRHLPYMLSLWEDIFTNPNMTDLDRLKTLVRMAASNMAVSVSSAGHSFAISASAGQLSPAAALAETFGGMSQVEFLKQIAEMDDLTEVLHKLGAIAAEVLDCGSLRCAVNTGESDMDAVREAMEGFVDSLPGTGADLPSYTESPDFVSNCRQKFYLMPFPVNFVGQSIKTVPYTHEDSPRLRVLARLLSSKFLHREIREKGGAYGSGARHSDGVFSFYSYRDPNSMVTLDSFHDSVEWAARGDFSERDVEEAKLSVFSQVDGPVAPGFRGSTMFVRGISDEMRQRYRGQLFKVDRDGLVQVTSRYLRSTESRSSAIIGPENPQISSNWTVKTFSL